MDYFVFEKHATSIKRKSNNNIADIVSFQPRKEITVKWKEWGEETFIYDKQNDKYVFENNTNNQ